MPSRKFCKCARNDSDPCEIDTVYDFKPDVKPWIFPRPCFIRRAPDKRKGPWLILVSPFLYCVGEHNWDILGSWFTIHLPTELQVKPGKGGNLRQLQQLYSEDAKISARFIEAWGKSLPCFFFCSILQLGRKTRCENKVHRGVLLAAILFFICFPVLKLPTFVILWSNTLPLEFLCKSHHVPTVSTSPYLWHAEKTPTSEMREEPKGEY